jgi:hypothetical protein
VGHDPLADARQRATGGCRSGVVHIEQPIGAKQAGHAADMAAQPAEELRIDADLAEPLEQQEAEGAGHAARLPAPALDRLEVA